MRSPFEVLGVEEDADEEAIERAYRERVKEVHPDHGGSLEAFVAVRTAYETLVAGDGELSAVTNGKETTNGHDTGGGSRAGSGTQSPWQQRYRSGAGGNGHTQDASGSQYWNAYHGETSEVTYLNYDVLADFGWSVDDDDLLEKATAAALDVEDYGTFHVQPGQSLLEAAENYEFAWPFACRGGACANCAIMLLEGELSMPVSHILPEELMEEGFRLSCNGIPESDELTVIFNVKHMPELEDLLLPPRPYKQAYDD